MNDVLLAFFGRQYPAEAACTGPQAVSGLPSREIRGTHPDLTERLWRTLAEGLPEGTRFILCGRPALGNPRDGRIFAVALGMAYLIRLPDGIDRTQFGPKWRVRRWSNGTTLDLTGLLGPEWVFGAFSAAEAEWCRINCAETHNAT